MDGLLKEELDWGDQPNFNLKVIPDDLIGLYVNEFCENYMYRDETASDGPMYLYTRVQ